MSYRNVIIDLGDRGASPPTEDLVLSFESSRIGGGGPTTSTGSEPDGPWVYGVLYKFTVEVRGPKGVCDVRIWEYAPQTRAIRIPQQVNPGVKYGQAGPVAHMIRFGHGEYAAVDEEAFEAMHRWATTLVEKANGPGSNGE